LTEARASVDDARGTADAMAGRRTEISGCLAGIGWGIVIGSVASLACESNGGSEAAASASVAPVDEASRVATRQSEFKAMSPAARIAEAKKMCFVGKGCDGDDLRLLLQTIESEAEREKLRQACRSVMIEQAQAALPQELKGIQRFEATGKEGRTIHLDADKCDSYFLEDVMHRLGKTARQLGFTEVECKREGGGATVPL